MELRHLRYFVAVAEELNFRRASQRLHIAQPSLSTQIKDLEYELGLNLFDRDTKTVRLTDAGRIYLEEVRVVLSHVQKATQLARETAEGRRGRLNIGNVGLLSSSFMPDCLSVFQKKYPLIEISLLEMRAREQMLGLDSGKIHIGVTAADEKEIPDRFQHCTILRTRLSVVLPQYHRLAQQESILLKDLASERLLCLHDRKQTSGHAERIRALFAASKLEVKQIKLVEEYESLLALIVSGQGLSIIPSLINTVSAKDIVKRPIADDSHLLWFQLRAMWRADETSSFAHNFIKILQKANPSSIPMEASR